MIKQSLLAEINRMEYYGKNIGNDALEVLRWLMR